jgi:hypothetical protein
VFLLSWCRWTPLGTGFVVSVVMLEMNLFLMLMIYTVEFLFTITKKNPLPLTGDATIIAIAAGGSNGLDFDE